MSNWMILTKCLLNTMRVIKNHTHYNTYNTQYTVEDIIERNDQQNG